MDVQLKRGVLDTLVLADLYNADSYGYLLLKDISAVIEVSESTLYPILRRLEKAKFLSTYTKEFDGRLRKYYSITDSGRKRLEEFKNEWRELNCAYEFVERRMNND